MEKLKTYRHGEILFIETEKIPEDAKQKKTDTLLVGSNNNPHTFKGGKFYELKENDFVFGFFEANKTTLYHIEHGKTKKGKKLKEAKLPDGVYRLRIGREFINSEMRPIKD